jgi:hypothetical protein
VQQTCTCTHQHHQLLQSRMQGCKPPRARLVVTYPGPYSAGGAQEHTVRERACRCAPAAEECTTSRRSSAQAWRGCCGTRWSRGLQEEGSSGGPAAAERAERPGTRYVVDVTKGFSGVEAADTTSSALQRSPLESALHGVGGEGGVPGESGDATAGADGVSGRRALAVCSSTAAPGVPCARRRPAPPSSAQPPSLPPVFCSPARASPGKRDMLCSEEDPWTP